MDTVITVSAIDNDRMLLDGMRICLQPVPDIHLVHTVATVDEYLATGATDQVVLLDLDLGDDSRAADNVARLTAHGCKVLIISIHARTEYVIATLEAGAEGYLTKHQGVDQLTAAIRQVVDGTLTPSPELAFAVTRDQRPTRPHLSPQEHRLFVYYARGMTLAAAARKINVEPRTAEDYLNRVKRKYAEVGRPARTKLELAERLREDGFQPPAL